MSRRRATSPALLYKIASILLQYPDEPLLARLGDVAAALPALTPPGVRADVGTVVDWLGTVPATEAAQHYVSTFDHTRRRSLYLTYYRHGDTRGRGMALLALNHTYRAAGYPPPERELPDFLPLILEFAALAPEPGTRILIQCQAGLELLRRALHEAASPYGHLLDALCAQLPALAPRHLAELTRLAAEGPPTEAVGLEPFAPPEYVTGERR
ncbi:MAG: nitrate reductase molybdenum cofactor assembly chaperone [Pseudonocardiales bacterium]|nr:nitrate reductase molybdenum cofactor assembly chaperone [Pseudonocardiales bacterium]